MSGELLDIVDKDNQPTGERKPRVLVHAEEVDWHRVTEVWIVNARYEVLCQQRSMQKDKNPGAWQAFFGGHVQAGQTYEVNATEELREELGLNVDVAALRLVGNRQSDEHRHFVQIYVLCWDGDVASLKFNDGEVMGVKWMTSGEVREVVYHGKQLHFTREYLLGYLDHMRSLNPEERRMVNEVLERRQVFDSFLRSKDLVASVCPSCGYPTLQGRGHFEICTICWWEDDGQDDFSEEPEAGGPNKETLTESRLAIQRVLDGVAEQYGLDFSLDPERVIERIARRKAVIEEFKKNYITMETHLDDPASKQWMTLYSTTLPMLLESGESVKFAGKDQAGELDLQLLHRLSFKSRAAILASRRCGCFYCLEFFAPQEIDEWTDEDENGVGLTALCPKCGIDSVLGDATVPDLSAEILAEMHECWFSVPSPTGSIGERLSELALSCDAELISHQGSWTIRRRGGGKDVIIVGNSSDEEFVLMFGGWHDHAGSVDSVVRFARAALRGECRIRTVYYGKKAYRWTLEWRKGTGWQRGSTMGALLLPFWLPQRIEYYANSKC